MNTGRIMFWFTLVCYFFNPFQINAFNLSDEAEISVLTCSAGNEIYDVYGHSAIRVKDVANNYDKVFNYGIFDFSTPNFVYRFASGQTDYLLGISNFEDFYEEYVNEKRSIFEQVLNLLLDEKQKIFDFLIWNAKPENRLYRYNFFFDNCATRIRDLLKNKIEGEVLFSGDKKNFKTFRNLIKEFHGKLLWVNFGIDLVIGSPSDKNASATEEMFLPDYLMRNISNSEIKKGDKTIALIKSSNVIYDAPKKKIEASKIISPFVVFLLLAIFIMYLSFVNLKRNKKIDWLDYVVYGLTGLTGLILLWFVIYSEHPAMSPNYNLIWAMPLNFVFALVWMNQKWRPFTQYFHVFTTIWLILYGLFTIFIPQQFHIVIFFFVVMVLSRSIIYTIEIYRNRKITNH